MESNPSMEGDVNPSRNQMKNYVLILRTLRCADVTKKGEFADSGIW